MNAQELQILKDIATHIKKVDKKQHSKWVDVAMRIAASVSTVGILAVFALFFATIPDIKNSINKLTWQNEQLYEQLAPIKAFMKEPRFTIDEYHDREDRQKEKIADIEAIIDVRGNWISNKDIKDNAQDYRINSLEKLVKGE